MDYTKKVPYHVDIVKRLLYLTDRRNLGDPEKILKLIKIRVFGFSEQLHCFENSRYILTVKSELIPQTTSLSFLVGAHPAGIYR